MSQSYFQFRQFTIHHDRCAMKVGTDGVLLGCWAALPQAGRILDIGTGSGLIALMAAQRSPASRVVGIDIDEPSLAQARENVLASPFADRVQILRANVLGYTDQPFDAILCNPPFYTEDTLPPDPSRQLARNASTLSFPSLIRAAAGLLAGGGTFSVIIPTASRTHFIAESLSSGLHLIRQCYVRTVERKEPKRILLTFQSSPVPQLQSQELILQGPDGQRTPQYQSLAHDFYLF